MEYGIHWFRRDLRVAGNLALQKQFKKHNGKVLGFFCFDKKFLSRPDFSVNRFQIFLKTLESLQQELRAIGSDLLFLDVGPFDAFPKLLKEMDKKGSARPKTVSWNRDYEPYARKRDEQLEVMMSENEVDYFHERDHLIVEPWELSKKDGTFYQVYTPFSRKWLELFDQEDFQKRVSLHVKGFKHIRAIESGKAEKIFDLSWEKLFKNDLPFEDHLNEYIERNGKNVDLKELPEAGSVAAYNKLKSFKNAVNGSNWKN